MLFESQKATLKADIIAKSASGQPLNALVFPTTGGPDWQGVAGWYNAASATNVWRPDAPRDAAHGAVNWKLFTPADMPPVVPATATLNDLCVQVRYHSLCELCALFQRNVFGLLAPSNSNTVDATQPSIRQGLQDSLSAIPSGTAGAAQDAGWVAVRNVLRRAGTRLEVLFSTADGAANKSTAYGQTVDGNDCLTAFSS